MGLFVNQFEISLCRPICDYYLKCLGNFLILFLLLKSKPFVFRNDIV